MTTDTTNAETIRPVRRGDEAAVAAMLEATGLFPPDELAEVMAMLGGHLDGALAGEHRWVLAEEGGRVLGAAYWAPERMTDGTWNLYMLAVHPERHGRGLGGRIVAHVEEACRGEGVRLLLVETLGVPDFAPQRAFYAKCGYEEEARVRDFYGAGFDKVIFRKLLADQRDAQAEQACGLQNSAISAERSSLDQDHQMSRHAEGRAPHRSHQGQKSVASDATTRRMGT